MRARTWVLGAFVALLVVVMAIVATAHVADEYYDKDLGAVTPAEIRAARAMNPPPTAPPGVTAIPRKLHFIYIQWGAPMSQEMRDNLEAWRVAEPTFEVKLWDGAAVDAIVPPEWRALYDAVPRPIMRVDLARLFILQREGGVYLDLDVRVWVTPLAQLLAHPSAQNPVTTAMFVAESRMRWLKSVMQAWFIPMRAGVPAHPGPRYCNNALAATPSHPVLAVILRTCRRRLHHIRALGMFRKGAHVPAYAVLFSTGPEAVNHTVQRFISAAGGTPFPRSPVEGDEAPIAGAEEEALVAAFAADEVKMVGLEEGRRGLVHTTAGSWRDGLG